MKLTFLKNVSEKIVKINFHKTFMRQTFIQLS